MLEAPLFVLALLVRASKQAEDDLNAYLFHLAILLAKGVPARVDECIENTVRSVGRCDVVSHADMSFCKCFCLSSSGP